MRSGMRRGWQYTGLVMLLICLATLWEAKSLSLFDRLGTGPGFFPFWLALIGAVLCGLVLLQVTLTPARADAPGDFKPTIFPRGAMAWRVAAILGGSALAALLLDWLGFRLSILIFSAVLLVALVEKRWWAVELFAVIAGFGLYHVFNNWLDVLLPVGIFGI